MDFLLTYPKTICGLFGLAAGYCVIGLRVPIFEFSRKEPLFRGGWFIGMLMDLSRWSLMGLQTGLYGLALGIGAGAILQRLAQ